MGILFKRLSKETIYRVESKIDALPFDVVLRDQEDDVFIELGNEAGDVTYRYCDMARAFILKSFMIKDKTRKKVSLEASFLSSWQEVNQLLTICEDIRDLISQAVHVSNVANDALFMVDTKYEKV